MCERFRSESVGGSSPYVPADYGRTRGGGRRPGFRCPPVSRLRPRIARLPAFPWKVVRKEGEGCRGDGRLLGANVDEYCTCGRPGRERTAVPHVKPACLVVHTCRDEANVVDCQGIWERPTSSLKGSKGFRRKMVN